MSKPVLEIEIVNWDKFNPRNDLKSTSWLRLSNSIFEDPDFFDFTHTELLTWIYVLSLASKKYSSKICINFAHSERIGRISNADLFTALEKLERNQCIKIIGGLHVTHTLRARNAENTDTSHYERTNEHNERNVTNEPVPEKIKKQKKPKDTPDALRARAELKAAWLFLYQKTFGHPYEGANSAFFHKTIKNIHETHGSEKSAQLMETYLAWKNPKVSAAGHPLHWLLNSVHALMAQLHRPDETMRRVAQGRAVERVLTDSQQRLAELEVLNERSNQVQLHNQLSSPSSIQVSGSAQDGIPQDRDRLDLPKPLRLASASGAG